MKFMKYLLATALVCAFCSSASISHAQTAVYTASGTSSLWTELGQAATSLPDTGCYWTFKSSPLVFANDDRGSLPHEMGDIWVAWGTGGTGGTCTNPVAPFNVYSEMSLDSVTGNRCFFATPAPGVAGCIQKINVLTNQAGNQNPACVANSLLGCTFTDTPLPAAVIAVFNVSGAPVRMNVAATDIRPEDAKFASIRMFANCGAALPRSSYENTSFSSTGLGYGVTPFGTPIQSFTNIGVQFNVYDFAISSLHDFDQFTFLAPVRSMDSSPATTVVTTVGAQPIIVSVGPVTATGISQATDIPFSALAEYLTGIYGRATDLEGPTAANPVVAILREPFSGTFNTMEFAIPSSNEFKTTQEVNNCNGANVKSNPLYAASANGKVPGAHRIRAIGADEEVAALINPSFCAPGLADCIGYWFWNSANAANFTVANQKYLTIDGVDPLFTNYAANPNGPGVIPTPANGGLPAVNFASLLAGDYPIWSELRLVSTPAAVPQVNALIAGAASLPITANDFVHVSKMQYWKSHFDFPGQPIMPVGQGNGMTIYAPGDLCSLAASTPESGGDAGGMAIYKVGNNDFCTDYNMPIGINDKNN